MKLIKDLGSQKPTEKSNYRKTYGIYECKCGEHFKVAHSAVKIGRIQRCRKCATLDKAKVCKIDYLVNTSMIHNNKYDYSKVIYWDVKTPVTIICPLHGEFEQSLRSHRQGSGCYTCGDISRSIVLRRVMDKRKCTLYYVFFEEYNLWKVGVTHDIHERFRGEPYKPVILHTIEYNTGIEAYFIEESLKNQFKEFNYKGPKVLHRKGNTELFTQPLEFKASVETIESTNEYKELVRKLVE